MNLTEIHKKIGQLMVVGFNGKKVTPEIRKLIREYHVGGIILFGRNIGTPEEVFNLTRELQLEAKNAGHERPLFICIDQENGVVRRLGEGTTIFPGAMLLGATGRSENAYITGLATGRELKALGINWNLAPVADINNNPDNPVIGVRSYGETPELVSDFAKQAMKGMNDAGVMTTLKHFPGHGDTAVDSHLDLPVINHDMERLMNVELKPFIACIEQGADTVMTSHVYFPAIEDQKNVPATLSNKVITGLLRNKIGFDGVVTTDCMEMNAISEGIGTAEGSVQALQAGVDLIMVSHLQTRQYESINAINAAITSGDIEMEVLDGAYERVMQLKDKYLSWADIPFHEQKVSEYLKSAGVGSNLHRAESYEIYKQGISILKNESHLIPIKKDGHDRILVVYPKNNYAMMVEDKRYATFSLGKAVKECYESTEIVEVSNPPTEKEISEVQTMAGEYDIVVVGTLTVQANDAQTKLVNAIYNHNKNVIVIATRSPYDIAYLPDVPVYINTYEFTYPALETAAKAIFGDVNVKGKSPVTIPNKVEV
ncbi:beta-N-acetylhexosaminidase [Virgibacillus soli]|uniref:beta-N-acetylhexosaminidase n=1 Tax=Paracerasibacillus soli TaxID=480284 RepID=UPI0035E5951E